MPRPNSLTPDIARAAGWDAGNRSMRAAGRTSWNEDDWNAATDETKRLMRIYWLRQADMAEDYAKSLPPTDTRGFVEAMFDARNFRALAATADPA